MKTKLDWDGVLELSAFTFLLVTVTIGLICLALLMGGNAIGWGNYFLTVMGVTILAFFMISLLSEEYCKRTQKEITKGIIPSWEEFNTDFCIFSEVVFKFEGKDLHLRAFSEKITSQNLSREEQELVIFNGSEKLKSDFLESYTGRLLDEKLFSSLLTKKFEFLFRMKDFNKKQLLEMIDTLSPLQLYGIAEQGEEKEYQNAFLDATASKVIFVKRMMDRNILNLIWSFREDNEVLKALKIKLSKVNLIPY